MENVIVKNKSWNSREVAIFVVTECLQNESDDGHDRFHEAELQCCLTKTIIHVNNLLTSQNIENTCTCIKIDAHLLAETEEADRVRTSSQAASTAPEACSKKKREKENKKGRWGGASWEEATIHRIDLPRISDMMELSPPKYS